MSKIRAPSALAADLLCDKVYQIAGLNPSDQILTHSGSQADLAGIGTPDDDDGHAQAFFQTIYRSAQGARIGAIKSRGQHLDITDINRLAGEFITAGARQFGFELFQFLFQRTVSIQNLLDTFVEPVRCSIEATGQLPELCLYGLYLLYCDFAGHACDTADACRNCGLLHDFELADVADPFNVRATTQFYLEIAKSQNPHPVTVLFSKQGSSPGLECIIYTHHIHPGRRIEANFLIDHTLYFK